MTRKQFWNLVLATRRATGGPNRAMADLLRTRLERRGAEETLGFARILAELMTESYDWRLWGAASVALGGCTDDSFDYFRCWLIGLGELPYSHVLADPEHLANEPMATLLEGGADFEELLYVAVEAYAAKTGEELDDPNPARSGYRTGPRGTKWRPAQLAKLYPRLTARFGRRVRP